MPELFTTPAAATIHTACATCGKALEMSSLDGFWLLDSRPYHAACAPWQGRPFPFLWATHQGRRVLARIRFGRIAPSPNLVRAVAWLEWAGDAWLPPDPPAMLRRAGHAGRVIDHWTNKLRPKTTKR